MIASTCLAILFVPSFYVLLQRLEEYWKRRGATTNTAATLAEAEISNVR
jgi:HAE1 family hydrophobic/amphiphilic exporter-1